MLASDHFSSLSLSKGLFRTKTYIAPLFVQNRRHFQHQHHLSNDDNNFYFHATLAFTKCSPIHSLSHAVFYYACDIHISGMSDDSLPEDIFRIYLRVNISLTIFLFINSRHLCSLDGSAVEDALANADLAAEETRAPFELLPPSPRLQRQSASGVQALLFQLLPGPCQMVRFLRGHRESLDVYWRPKSESIPSLQKWWIHLYPESAHLPSISRTSFMLWEL